MQALELIGASAVAESYPTHSLHNLVFQIAKENRERVSPETRKAMLPTEKAVLPISGNRAARRAAVRGGQEVAA